MTCPKCAHLDPKRFGTYGAQKIQRFRCRDCGATFSEPHAKPLGSHTTTVDDAARVFSLLIEGMSVRAVSRVTGIHKNTILGLLQTIGAKCAGLFDAKIRHIRSRRLQCDEIWSFVGSMRMCMRRFTRLTNAFSKTQEHHAAMVNFYFMHYNFCRVHQTLDVTPAMESGLTDHVWSVSELLAS